MGVQIYIAFSVAHNFPSRWFTRDDAYYYFKVAENISEGHGSTFDGINVTNGYHPLWMIICIPIFSLARFDLILPLRILLVVMAGLSCITSILLFRLLRKYAGLFAAMMAASFWALSLEIHGIVTQQGMETGIVALAIVLFLYFMQQTESKLRLSSKDLGLLGFLGLLVLFSRLDSIFLIIIAGIWIVFRKNTIRYLLSIDLLFTLSIIVFAFIDRASLEIYLLAFDQTALVYSGIIFIFQSIIFYYMGLYERPANITWLRILILSVISVLVTTLIAFITIFAISPFKNFTIPRAVPFYYLAGMLLYTLISRAGLKLLSPRSLPLTREHKPFTGILAGKSQLKAANEPLKNWFHDGLIYFGIIATGLGLYFLINWLMFGTFMPVSGQIKEWWGSLPNNVYGGATKSLLDVFGIDPSYSQAWNLFFNPVSWLSKILSTKQFQPEFWYWILTFLFVAGLVSLVLSDRKKNFKRIFMLGLIPLTLGAVFHTIYFGSQAYSAKQEWYWVMQMLAVVITFALATGLIFEKLSKYSIIKQIPAFVTGIFIIFLAYTFSTELIDRMPFQDAMAGQPYMDTLPILENFTEPGAIIGMTGGGNTGYFIHGRTIVNMDGLINSYQYFQALKNNEGGIYLAKRGLNYIFANPYIITNTMPYRYQFNPNELLPVPGAPAYGQKVLMHFRPEKK